MAALTAEQIADMRGRHRPCLNDDECCEDEQAWPCDAARLLDALEEAEAKLTRLNEEWIEVSGAVEARAQRAEEWREANERNTRRAQQAEIERDGLAELLRRARAVIAHVAPQRGRDWKEPEPPGALLADIDYALGRHD